MKFLSKLIIAFSVLFISIKVFAQSKYVADKYFSEFAYTKSAQAYKNLYDKGEVTYDIVSRLSDSYYFMSDMADAQKWYAVLYEKFPDVIDHEHLFRYTQALKGVGNYQEADKIMKVMGKLDTYDSRPEKLKDKPNYVTDFKKPMNEVLHFNNLDINTKYSDFGGFVSKGKLYFASSKPNTVSKRIYKWNEQPYLNLYTGNVNVKDNGFQVSNSVLLEKPLSTKFHEASAVITRSGKTMYFTRDNHHKGVTNMSRENNVLLKLYRATLVDGKWSKIVELPFNSNEYSVGHPALSPDEKTLYFVSNMPGGFGATDIYKVAILPNLKYGEPYNLGQEINTEGREMFPFVSSDNILYFSSDGHLGLGGLDIFEASIYDELFGKVTNLEVPFNSPLDDFSFYIDKNNLKGVLSSNRKGGVGDDDIYSFVLKNPRVKRGINKQVQNVNQVYTSSTTNQQQFLNAPQSFTSENCKQILIGIVSDKSSGVPLANTKVDLIDYQGKIVETSTSDKQGVYKFNVNCLTGYRVLASKLNYRNDLQVINSTHLNRGSNLLNLALSPLIKGNKISIRPIYFDFNKANIRPDSQYELEHVVNVMRDNPQLIIKIESHTDCRGARQYNRNLSDQRAKSTRGYIVSRGISPSRIQSAIGYGEDRLLNHCDDANSKKCSEEEHQLNRRSYFIIVNQDMVQQ